MDALKPRTVGDVLHDFAKDVLSMNRNWFAESPDEIHIPDGAKYAADLREMMGTDDDYKQAADYWRRMCEELLTERTCYVIENLRKYVLSDGTELFENGCSVCYGYIGDGDNYCSNCGAKVVKE